MNKSGGMREVSRRAVQAEIVTHALRLFAEQGFDGTTVEQIAAAAGVSSRTFFRYFAVKEDVIIGDPEPLGRLLGEALRNRPAGEPAGVALRAAIVEFMGTVHEAPGRALQLSRLMSSTPSLRARHLEKQLLWQRLLVPQIRARLRPDDPTLGELRAQALVGTALACLDVAVLQWAATDGSTSLESLLDAAFATVSTELS